MIGIRRLFVWVIAFDLAMVFASDFFNLTLKVPNINITMSNQSIYVAMKLPIDEEFYIADFNPIYNRQKVHSITTYLCSRPFSTKENFWFGNQPCHKMDQSVLIHEWYYNIPDTHWPKDAGIRVGTNTPYRCVVIQIQYLTSIINDIYGQQLIMTHNKPQYKIGMLQIETDLIEYKNYHADFSCQYHSSSIQIFSAKLYSNYEGRSIALYRVRNNQSQSIIKGNLAWPQTFYQLENPIEIKINDYLIGRCVYENKSFNQNEYKSHDLICQITIMFSIKQEDEIPTETCWNNDYPQVVESFLPIDVNVPPQTLFDINPTYPKLTPDEWAIIALNKSLTDSKLIDNKTNLLFLTYAKDNHRESILHFIKIHKLLFICSLWGFAILVGFLILCIVINRSRKSRKYVSMNNNIRSRAITVGGDTSSLSEWLTKRRFQQYDQNNNNDDGETKPLTRKHRWASSDEETELSDNEVFNKLIFRKVIHKK